MWQAVLFDPRPFRPSVARDVHAAARSPAKFSIGVHFELPHSGEEHSRVVRIHGKPGAPDVLSGKKYSFPMRSAVHRAVNAALLLRPSRPSKRASKNNLRIRWVNDDSAYAASFLQAHVGPGLPGIGGLIDSVTDHI